MGSRLNKKGYTMKWHNMNEFPIFAKDTPVLLDEFYTLLVTDGDNVEVTFFNIKNETMHTSTIKKPTYWMFPAEVFSPKQMMKLLTFVKS